MAIIKLMAGFDKKQFREFVSVRKYFEEFLITNARALGETISAKGSRGRSVPTLIAYYKLVMEELLKGSAPKTILGEMRKQPKLFPFAENLPDFTVYGAEFSAETKSAAFLTDALRGCPVCRICESRYQPDSVNADHKLPIEDGGIGSPKNIGPTHYYCNSSKRTLKPLISAAWQRIETRLSPTRKPPRRKTPSQ